MPRGILLTLLVLLIGCDFFRPKELNGEKPIARVKDMWLYPSDFTGLIPPALSSEDSTKFASKFVDDWIKKQLMIARSQEEVDINEAEIQRKVLDYTYALTRSAFEREYIESNLNVNISEDEIQTYYKEHSQDFVLKQGIVRCLFAQVPTNAPKINRFRKNLVDYPRSSTSQLKEYCTQFANRSFLEDSVWVEFNELISGTPFDEVLDANRLLYTRSLLESVDGNHAYFLRILAHKTVNDISPLEFVRDDIENILINKRKIALKRELEDKVYEDAQESNAFEIFDR